MPKSSTPRNLGPAPGKARKLLHLAIDADHHADDLRLAEVRALDVDGLQARVRRLEPDAVSFGVVALHRGLVLDHRHHDLAGPCLQLLADEDVVAVEDAVADHRVAGDAQREHLPSAIAEQHAVDANVVGDVLVREDRRAGRDLPDHRHLDRLALADGGELPPADPGDAPAAGASAVDDAEGAALQLAAHQVALPFERLEMIVDAVGGADPEVLADLADGRPVSLVLDALLDEGEDLFLALGQRLGHGRANLLNA